MGSLTFDESNARLTELMCGRTVDCVIRKGKELVIVLTNGVEVTIQTDVNGDIHYKNHETKVHVKGLAFGAQQGVL